MIDPTKTRLGEILVDRGMISESQLEEALAEQKVTKEFLGAALIRKKLIKEKDLLKILSEQLAMQCIDLENSYIDWAVPLKFSPSLVLDHKVFPVSEDESTFTFAISNPTDAWALQKAEEEAKGLKGKSVLRANFVLASEKSIESALERYKQHLK